VAGATSTVSSASTGASIGTQIYPGVGTAIGAVVGAAYGLLSGGGDKQTAEQKFQGYQVDGSVGPGGFSGTVKGAFSDGIYPATGETSYINGLGRSLLGAVFSGSETSDADIDRFFKENGPIPISLNAGKDNTRIPATVSTLVTDAVKKYAGTTTLLDQLTKPSTMDAPTISGAVPAGTPITLPNTAGAVTSDVNTLTSTVLGNPLLLLALAGALIWALSKKG
jgi:hypothetical protein